jgi:hypothetical protein
VSISAFTYYGSFGNKVCQFLHSPTTVHLGAVKCILRYIKASTNLDLKIRKTNSIFISAFSDAD